MKEYNKVLQNVLTNGIQTDDRTGYGTLSLFGDMFEFDLKGGKFPAVTNKKLAWKAVVSELIWFIKGSTDVNELRDILHGPNSTKTTIWDANYTHANEKSPAYFSHGNLGPVYGHQWRYGNGVDQLADAIELIKTDPNSRRIIVNSWAPSDLPMMALPPCHFTYQFSVKGRHLNLAWTQR